METLKAALMGEYEVRKTDAQKTAFITWVKERAQEMGYSCAVEESGKRMRTRNIVFGDLSRAKTLICAHYDTCPRMPFPNFLTPNFWPGILLTQILVPFALFFGIGVLCGRGMGRTFAALGMSAGAKVACALLLYGAICAAIIGPMLFGPANPHTANDNTSGVAAVLLAMRALAGRDDIAFILFDNEEKGMIGSSAFAKKHKNLQKQAFVVNLDCVSDGDTLFYAYSKAAKACPQADRLIDVLEKTAPAYGKRAQAGQYPAVFYPSDQLSFACGTAFAALKGEKILYLDRIHTAKDTMFDEENIKCLIEVLEKAL